MTSFVTRIVSAKLWHQSQNLSFTWQQYTVHEHNFPLKALEIKVTLSGTFTWTCSNLDFALLALSDCKGRPGLESQERLKYHGFFATLLELVAKLYSSTRTVRIMIWFWTCSTIWCTSHPNSLDVPQAIFVVPAIRRKVFWLAQAHRLLGYFNQWVGWNRISWYWHLQITKMFFVYSWTRWKPLTTLTYRGLKGAEFCTCFRPVLA